MEGTMAEFTVRLVREDNDAKAQLVVDGSPVKETSPKPVSLTGNKDYLEIFGLVLNEFSKRK